MPNRLLAAALVALPLVACKSTRPPAQWEYAVLKLGEFMDLSTYSEEMKFVKSLQSGSHGLGEDELIKEFGAWNLRMTEFTNAFDGLITEQLNVKGRQGWELVLINWGTELESSSAYFKRAL